MGRLAGAGQWWLWWLSRVALPLLGAALHAQGTVRGIVRRSVDLAPLAGVQVELGDHSGSATTSPGGRFTLRGLPAGPATVLAFRIGYAPDSVTVVVPMGGTVEIEFRLAERPVELEQLIVEGPSRRPEAVVEAPASVSLVRSSALSTAAPTEQLPLILTRLPGVELVQSGATDFNVNTRGFNTSLNRRVLVLLDGRDLAVPLLGAQEWNAFPLPSDELERAELVRGPASALYGANAFNGVLVLQTPLIREAIGSRITIAGGEPATFRARGRQAGLLLAGRLGYRLEAGYARSDQWSASRTWLDGSSLRREYGRVTSEPVPDQLERVALAGQTVDPTTGAPRGRADPLHSAAGQVRLEWYAGRGTASVEAGLADVANEVYHGGGAGRFQIPEARRRWVRAGWTRGGFQLFGYVSDRRQGEPGVFLGSGTSFDEQSRVAHVEGQYRHPSLGGRLELTGGASLRATGEDTHGTLLDQVHDDRHDGFAALFGSAAFRASSWLKVVAAARYDRTALFADQFSPQGAIVVSPGRRNAFHFSVNRAFQAPVFVELFLRTAGGAPIDLSALEQGLRASPLGPALAGVPDGTLFTTSSAVPVEVRGNRRTRVETVTSVELGYTGSPVPRVDLQATLYRNRLSDFVTGLQPGVNPDFPAWTAPPTVPSAYQAAIEQAVHDELTATGADLVAAGLSRGENGNTAVVLSYTNAGRVTERGLELGLGVQLNRSLRVEGTFTWFDATVDRPPPGAPLEPNTPGTRGSATIEYDDRRLLVAATLRLSDGFIWATGLDRGYIPAMEWLDLGGTLRLATGLEAFVSVTDVLNQRRFQIYGGSVLGRRALAGLRRDW